MRAGDGAGGNELDLSVPREWQGRLSTGRSERKESEEGEGRSTVDVQKHMIVREAKIKTMGYLECGPIHFHAGTVGI